MYLSLIAIVHIDYGQHITSSTTADKTSVHYPLHYFEGGAEWRTQQVRANPELNNILPSDGSVHQLGHRRLCGEINCRPGEVAPCQVSSKVKH